MDSRYSAQSDSYRLPEEAIRIDLRAERARRKKDSAQRSSPERPAARRSTSQRSSTQRLTSPRTTTQRATTTRRPTAQRTASRRPPAPTPSSARVPAQHPHPQTPEHTLARRRGLALVGILVVAVVGIIAAVGRNSEPEAPAPQPTEPAKVITEPAAVIEPSPAVEMYIPSIDVRASFEEGSCRVKDNKIDPDSMGEACTYTAEDKPYSLPGTDAADIVVIAGHTGAGVPAVFNNLYDGRADEHKASIGDKLYLRTENSGEEWLVYAATDLHDPSKEGLEQDASIWGEGPMPGRLLTISCIQPANLLAAAERNAVVGWQFEGVTTTPESAE